jgi:hypothetical protein
MPEAERTDPDGVDYGWVMQATFVATILLGAPVVAILALTQPLPTWSGRVFFAIQIGAPIWLLTSVVALVYEARFREA